MQDLEQLDAVLRLAQPRGKRPVRQDVEGSVAKVYRNMGRVSVRELQTIAGENWAAEWPENGGDYTLIISNGAALPEQGDIVQVGKPNTRGSLIVDTARSRRLLGKTAAAFLATPKAHDIILEPTCFRYHRLKEAMHKMKGRFPQRFASIGIRRAHPTTVFKKRSARAS